MHWCSSWWFLLNVNSLLYRSHEYRTKGNATKAASTVHPDDINEKFNFLGRTDTVSSEISTIVVRVFDRFADNNPLMVYRIPLWFLDIRLSIPCTTNRIQSQEESSFVTYSNNWRLIVVFRNLQSVFMIRQQQRYIKDLRRMILCRMLYLSFS